MGCFGMKQLQHMAPNVGKYFSTHIKKLIIELVEKSTFLLSLVCCHLIKVHFAGKLQNS